MHQLVAIVSHICLVFYLSHMHPRRDSSLHHFPRPSEDYPASMRILIDLHGKCGWKFAKKKVSESSEHWNL